MLVILSTHPIQYQVPLWQALAADGRVPFEVWYMSDHGTKVSHDVEFGTKFAWDIDMLAGYPHRFMEGAGQVHPAQFWDCRIRENLVAKLREAGAKALWIQGWQVAGYWQAAFAARRAGAELWLRGESNDLAPTQGWKKLVKRHVLGRLLSRVDRFLYIGAGNRRLYESYGARPEQLLPAPYCVDNDRFRAQAEVLRPRRAELRRAWGIAEDAFVPLFCGKFIPKKRPQDLVEAASHLKADGHVPNIHLLLTGSGELGPELRSKCHVVYDADSPNLKPETLDLELPKASFAGFLNQSRISEAYVAADCLVLPSDYGETWGLVVNEALASGIPCIISERCGSSADLGSRAPNQTFPFSDVAALAGCLHQIFRTQPSSPLGPEVLSGYNFDVSVQSIANAWSSVPNS